jgi:hypothetical protein
MGGNTCIAKARRVTDQHFHQQDKQQQQQQAWSMFSIISYVYSHASLAL